MAIVEKANKHLPIRLSTMERKNDTFGQMGIENKFTIESLTEDVITATRNTLGPRISEAEVNQIRAQVNTELRIKYGIEAKPLDANWVPIGEAAKQLGVSDRTVRRIIAEGHAQSTRQLVPVQIHNQELSHNSMFRQVEKTFVSFDDLVHYRENRNLGGRPRKQLGLQQNNK